MATTKVHVQKFEVQGTGMFPMDMLRYDSCCPDRSEDAHEIARGENPREVRTIRLRRYAVNSNGPTEARWSSFGWSVVADSLREE